MEFSQWMKKYQFLEEIIKLYGTLDKPVAEDDQYQDVLNSCDNVSFLPSDPTGIYKSFCKKLSRNLLLLDHGNYGGGNFFKYCNILYMWMYFEIQKYNLNAKIINKIFQGSVNAAKQKSRKQISCPYFSYSENLHEPEKLMKLSIFNDNIETLKKILNNINDSNNCSCLEYVYECINIYNDMNNRFCATPEDKNTTNKDTCDKLNNFNSNYSSYIRNVKGEIYELPFLSDTTTARHTPTSSHVTRCSANKQKQELGSGSDVQSSSPKQISISTALSTMAGIPPFLALIYKFTPVGTWFRSKYRKDADVIKNLDEDIEKELYYPRPENENINSSQARYNVAYEPV